MYQQSVLSLEIFIMVINSQKNCSILNIDIHSFGHSGIREWFKDKLKTTLQVNHVAVSLVVTGLLEHHN